MGGLATVGLKFSRGREEEKEDPRMWAYAKELFDRFREEIVKKHGGGIFGVPGMNYPLPEVDWKDRDQVKEFLQRG